MLSVILTENLLNYLHFRMLDDFGNEFEITESKLDATMKKIAKVLHMNNGIHIYHLLIEIIIY